MSQVFLFRHGDKRGGWDEDPTLSPLGERQAEALADWISEKRLPTPQALWCSPRKRAVQSFAPLSRKLNLPLRARPELLERTGSESRNQFEQRVNHLLEEAQRESGPLFICSHYDWLEEAVSLLALPSNFSWRPMSFVALHRSPHGWELQSTGQVTP